MSAPEPAQPAVVANGAKSNGAAAPVIPEPGFFTLFVSKFLRDDILLRASALAYSTLISLVPVFAIILTVLSGNAFKDKREAIMESLADRFVPADTNIIDPNALLNNSNTFEPEDDVTDVKNNGESKSRLTMMEDLKAKFREQIEPLAERAGTVSIFGFGMLLVTVGLLYANVEKAFNAIWRVKKQRAIFMRISIATSMIFWAPMIFAASVSLAEVLSGLPVIGTWFVPALFTSLLFAAFYTVFPNAPVRVKYALAAGAATAFVWEAARLLFMVYVIKVVGASHVYGSLGLIPILFLWVYLNWVMTLSGGVLAYTLQNRYEMSAAWKRTKQEELEAGRGNEIPAPPALVLAVAFECVRRFKKPDSGPQPSLELAIDMKADPTQVRQALRQLERGGILARALKPRKNGNNTPLLKMKITADVGDHLLFGEGGAAHAEEDHNPRYLLACDPRVKTFAELMEIANGGVIPASLATGGAWENSLGLVRDCGRLSVEKYGHMTLDDLADAPRQGQPEISRA